MHSVSVYQDAISSDNDYSEELSRFDFENICAPIFERMFPPLDKAIEDSKLSKEQIEDIVLVGGSTRIP